MAAHCASSTDGPHDEFKANLFALGSTPIPYYIDREPNEDDVDRYQTIFAEKEGAVVAPSAGLHFSRELMTRMEIKGIYTAFLTMHVGLGSYRDIDVEDLTKHRMDSEQMEVTPELSEKVNTKRDAGHKICAVGTSVLRAMETCVGMEGHIKAYDGWTNKFIFPPYECTTCDALISNFHMPYSVMLMVATAFGGYDHVMNAYKVAIEEKYRLRCLRRCHAYRRLSTADHFLQRYIPQALFLPSWRKAPVLLTNPFSFFTQLSQPSFMKRILHLIICLCAMASLSVQAAEVTYRVAYYNADAGEFVLESWGEQPAQSMAYFDSEYGATRGNRYNQIPRNQEAEFSLYGWEGCTINSITFYMCSNSKAGTIGYSVIDGVESIYTMPAVGFDNELWFGQWLSKDLGIYADIKKELDLPALTTNRLVINLKAGTSEGSVYVDGITIEYDAPADMALESPMGWVYEKLEKKSVLAEGDQILLYRSGSAAANLDDMATVKYLDAIGVNNTKNVTEPDVLVFSLAKDGEAWTMTDQYGRRLGATGERSLAWDAGVDTWNITLGYDGATIASTNTNYGTLRYNAPAESYARFCNYTSNSLALPYMYRRVRQLEPTACTDISLSYQERTVQLSLGDTLVVKATLAPEKVTDKRVFWSSSRSEVATVKSGIIMPQSAGTTIITATDATGSVSAQMRLTVTDGTQPQPGDVNTDGSVNVGDVTALINTVLNLATYPIEQCDIDGNGVVNVSDVTALINLLLSPTQPQ